MQRVAHGDQPGGRGHKTDAGVGLMDKKLFELQPLWAEGRLSRVDEELATQMDTCKYATHAVSSSTLVGLSACDVERHWGFYQVMKKLLKPHKDAGPVQHVEGGNPFEAWRQIDFDGAAEKDERVEGLTGELLDGAPFDR